MSATRAGSLIGGKYHLNRLLGEGGMGEVYEAQHVVIGRRFAIKFLHAHLTHNPEVMARFHREAQAAGALENENIAAALDFGTADDGAPFLVMEYLEGEDLARLLARSGTLPVPRAVNIAIQACRGLMPTHDRHIVHRDLKPENLFICRRNDRTDLVKILDFGIAKLRDLGNVTQSGATVGTPSYMSMEQARGARDVDHRTDIYSLGVILYEALGGSKPHPGSSYNEIIYHIVTEDPRPLGSLRSLPPGLCLVVEKAMAREASDRFSSVVELAEALAPFAGREITPLRTETALPVAVPLTATQPSPVTCPPSESAGASWLPGAPACLSSQAEQGLADSRSAHETVPSARRPRLWMVLVVGMVAAVGVAAWLAPSATPSPVVVAPAALDPLRADAAVDARADAAPHAEAATADGGRRPPGQQPGHLDTRARRIPPAHIPLPSRPKPGEEPVSPGNPRKGIRPFDRANPYDN